MDSAPRAMQPTLLARASRHATLTVTGPRQSGKTTLCRLAFPHLEYVNLEDPTTRSLAQADPSSFVHRYQSGAIFDEVQRTPELLSAIQVAVDADPRPGRFVLSGSHNFQLQGAIAQSLAGRTTILDLLPLTHAELAHFHRAPKTLPESLLQGGYPRILAQGIPAAEFHADYVRTYVERDVRQMLAVRDLGAFQTMLRLCAGRTAGLANLSSLAADCGITQPTARAWLQTLEASYLIRTVRPWFANLGKRLVKTPKLHFLDSGLAAWLLGLRTTDHVETHPLRGALFESWVVAEILKSRCNDGHGDPVWFYRDATGTEVDLVVETHDGLLLVEVKSGARVATDTLEQLERVTATFVAAGHRARGVVVHGGNETAAVRGVQMLPWRAVAGQRWY